MKKTKLHLLFLLFLLLFNLNTFAQDFTKITGTLRDEIEENPDDFHTIILHLKDRIDVEELREHIHERNLNTEARAQYVVNTLYEKARITQPALLKYLKGIPGDNVERNSFKPFWITNAISLKAKKEFIYELSQRDDIEKIYGDIKGEIDEVEYYTEKSNQNSGSTSLNENLKAINAHKMWELGYTGYGTKVLIIDSGVEYTHPALRQQFYGNVSPYAHAWSAKSPQPFDFGGHGTHVAGIIAGLDRNLKDTVGVAFNTHWMGGPSQFLFSDEIPYEVLGTMENLQYALNPDGDINTVDDIPDAINNSWGPISMDETSCDPNSLVSQIGLALEAAGIAVVWSAGNYGPEFYSVRGYKNNNLDLVSFFSVGSLEKTAPYEIAGYSSRGPSLCGGEGSLAIKPEVSAPGQGIHSLGKSNTYKFSSGTSMAAPHVTGAVLLLKEAFPDLSGEKILLALYFSALDLGVPGEDNIYGMGMIDVFAAYNYLIENGNIPVPPVANDLDIIANNIYLDAKDLCSDNYPLSIDVLNGGSVNIFSFEIFYNLDGVNEYSGSKLWEGVLEPGEVLNMFIDSIPLNGVGLYQAEVMLVNPNNQQEFRVLNNQVREEINVVSENPPPHIYTEFIPCANGESIHYATSNIEIDTSTIFEWFYGIGRNPFSTGDTCTIRRNNFNQTLFVRESYFYETGMKSDSLTFTYNASTFKGLQFDAHQDFILKSVRSYIEELPQEGYCILYIQGPDYSLQRTVGLNSAGFIDIDLDLKIPKGNGYIISINHPYSNHIIPTIDKNVNFPYTVDNVISINSSISNNSPDFENYNPFFDWQIVIPTCGHHPHYYELMDNIHNLRIISSMDTLNLAESNEVFFDFDAEFTAQSILWNFGTGNQSSFKENTVKYSEPGIYEISLIVYFQDDCSFELTKNIVVINEPVSVQTYTVDDFQIYPNPFNDIIYIESEKNLEQNSRYTISSLAGQILQSDEIYLTKHNKAEIRILDFPSGVYILTIENDGNKIIQKIVK